MRRLTPKRQRTLEESRERADIVNRLYASATRLAHDPRVQATPEELMDYRRADSILSRGKQ